MAEDVRVLVVDEDRDILDLTTTFLERLEPAITTATAGGGPAALDRLAAGEFDAVVSDHRMPELSGLEFAAAIHDRGLDLPFVLFTADDDPDTGTAVDEAHVDAFVLKGHGVERYEEIAGAILDAVE